MIKDHADNSQNIALKTFESIKYCSQLFANGDNYEIVKTFENIKYLSKLFPNGDNYEIVEIF